MTLHPLIEDDPRVKAKADELREWMTLDAAINILAAYMVASEITEKLEDESYAASVKLAAMAKSATTDTLGIISIARSSTQIASVMAGKIIENRSHASKRGKIAADALHNKPGGSREKQNAIRAAWASGKYSSREVCAEQECAGLDMSFSAARRALRNTTKPT